MLCLSCGKETSNPKFVVGAVVQLTQIDCIQKELQKRLVLFVETKCCLLDIQNVRYIGRHI